MLIYLRWLVRLLTGLFGLGFLAVLLGVWLISRSLPDYSESFAIEGISAPVEILRDNSSVPHIFGATDQDVFFALGFAHAQDRLWQMTMLRRTAQGRLSEVFGRRTLAIDEVMRRFDLYNLSIASVDAQDDDTKAALTAYANGVNAWITQINLGARGRGAPEMLLFSNEIAAWTPADSIAIVKLMAVQLSGHMEAEVLRARTSLLLPEERLIDILPDDPTAAVIALPDYASLMPSPVPGTGPVRMAGDPLSPFAALPFAGASNAWAAAPERSAAGMSLLANDPHLGFTAPAIWYLARLELSSGGVIGATLPGVPAVLLGRSERLGWGLTSAYVDDQDVVIEKLNPDNPAEYDTGNGFEPFVTRPSIIEIKDELPETLTLQWSQSGPILPAQFRNVGSVTPEGHVAALAWTALSSADTSMTAAMKIMRAATVNDALKAGEYYIAPAQNLTVVDQNSIAFQVIGRVPKRDAAHPTQGRMPALGTNPATRWQGAFPYATNPREVNPPSGIIGNTNNRTVARPFPEHLSYLWGDSQRIQRWLALMQTREVHTRESFIEAQLDTVSPAARAILPLIGAELWFTGEPAPEGTPERLRQRALAVVAEWNGEMNEHLPEPLIWMAWFRALNERLIRDELGPLADEYSHPDPVFIERVFRDIGGASVWCDILQSATVETCPEIARLALDDALLELTETYGPNPESWRWGQAHEATHDHAVLGEVPFVKWFVNIRQSTSGGDFTLQRGRTKGEGPNPYLNVHGAGYRGVYDFADPDSSVFIISTGQSGHPFSSHYDDLGERWRRGEYVPMSLDPDLARAAAVGVTQLTPAAP